MSFFCFDLVLAICVPDSTSGVRYYLSSHKFTLAILVAFMPYVRPHTMGTQQFILLDWYVTTIHQILAHFEWM